MAAETDGLTSMSIVGGKWRVISSLPHAPHIFEGQNVETGRTVYIKALNPSAAMDRAIRSRFLKESKLLNELDHPNLVQVLDVVDNPEMPAMVMDNPAGESLLALIERKGFLPIPVALNFANQLLDALDYLHAQGVVHRNLNAATIHVSRSRDNGLPHLVLTDFGVARSVHLASEVKGDTGTLLGMQVTDSVSHLAPTPYMAPELLREESDSRTDIYGVGVLIFEMIAGRKPMGHGVTDPEKLLRIVKNEKPTMLRLLCPTATRGLEEALQRMMSKNPDDRFIDVNETRNALSGAAQESMVGVPSGAFVRGSDPEKDASSRPEEQPQRHISTSAFFVDRTPVTAGEFREFLNAKGAAISPDWDKHNPTSAPHHPAVYVTWQDAADYAEAHGKRLATEAEWEKAARGTDGRRYPWGNKSPNADVAQFSTQSRTPVTAHPAGASPYGCLDMAGNVFEWVGDWYHKAYYQAAPQSDPQGPSTGKKKVLRGGSFVHEAWAIRCATRGRYAPEARRANHSFRCVWSIND